MNDDDLRAIDALNALYRTAAEAAREFVTAKRELLAIFEEQTLHSERCDVASARLTAARGALDAAVDALPPVTT